MQKVIHVTVRCLGLVSGVLKKETTSHVAELVQHKFILELNLQYLIISLVF
jgi:hypothetical protein